MVKYRLLIWLTVIMVVSCSHPQNDKKIVITAPFKKVAFILYENFDSVMLHTAIDEVKSFYHCDAVLLPSQPLPSFAYYKPRYRYKADSIIKYQATLLPPGTQSVMGLTNKDISTSTGRHDDWEFLAWVIAPVKPA